MPPSIAPDPRRFPLSAQGRGGSRVTAAAIARLLGARNRSQRPFRPPRASVRQLNRWLHTRSCCASEPYPFLGVVRENMPQGIPFHVDEYLELISCTDRAARRQARGHRRGSSADLGADRHHPSGLAAAGQGLRDSLLQLDRSRRAWRAGLRARWSALGARHPRLPAAVSRLSSLRSP